MVTNQGSNLQQIFQLQRLIALRLPEKGSQKKLLP